jgi:hypothetical protein
LPEKPSVISLIERIDDLIGRSPDEVNPSFAPHWGWHDDHAERDGTPAYLPAIQQVRGELVALLDELAVELPRFDVVDPYHLGHSCLQLGLGYDHGASHQVWRLAFDEVVSLDLNGCRIGSQRYPGCRTDTEEAFQLASAKAPYDLLFIDAGHTEEEVRKDYETYAPLVRRGGFVAFHDALYRSSYPEVEVHKFLSTFTVPVSLAGNEVGLAWVRVK